MKFSWKYFHGALATSTYYLPKAKNSWENFRGKLKNCENCKSLTQRIFSCLRYMIWVFMLFQVYIYNFEFANFSEREAKYTVIYSRTLIIQTPVCHSNDKGVQINEFVEISDIK